uniref:Uncharacterized protein n=1 Tax=Candidatus Kentrum sp. DK TaxID=2126562 RepID=A0A450TPK0_9GAMM|nr:MAG: hypothetical protein BECKDK2373B_GA0170837_12571 [Candidatus Kentron sp. DK]
MTEIRASVGILEGFLSGTTYHLSGRARLPPSFISRYFRLGRSLALPDRPITGSWVGSYENSPIPSSRQRLAGPRGQGWHATPHKFSRNRNRPPIKPKHSRGCVKCWGGIAYRPLCTTLSPLRREPEHCRDAIYRVSGKNHTQIRRDKSRLYRGQCRMVGGLPQSK